MIESVKRYLWLHRSMSWYLIKPKEKKRKERKIDGWSGGRSDKKMFF